MLKKILYAIVVIVIIVILTIMWTDSKKTEAPMQDLNNQVQQVEQVKTDTPTDINKDIDSINVDSGIDADLNGVDTDVKTL